MATSAEHLWLHFSRLSASNSDDLVAIERGEGAYVYDTKGNRYLDGLAGLFVVQAGHGRRELAEVAAAQMEQLAYFPLWGFTHPRAEELSARLADLAPGDLNRVFFTSGGSEANETAWKLARQYFVLTGEPERYKVIARRTAYHGTSLGALSITGLEPIKEPFRPLLNGATRHAVNTNRRRCELCTEAPACTLSCADDIERLILAEGPETVAAVFIEPVQNAGGCFVPAPGYLQRVREICDRHGVLLVADEVINAFGRVGAWFGSGRFDLVPDMLTFAKGVTSGYAPLGGVLVRDRIVEPFVASTASFAHGITFGGHPVSCAVGLANLDVMEKEDLVEGARRQEGEFRGAIETLLDLPIVAEIRGLGFFHAIELTNDGEPLNDAQRDWLVRGFLPRRLLELGLYCRADDRGDPIVQLAPPLVCGPAEFEAMASIIRQGLTEAWADLPR